MVGANVRAALAATAAAAIVGASFAVATPAAAASATVTRVGSTSDCQDVVFIGAEGSGETADDRDGLGSEVGGALDAYARHLDGYKIGYFPVPYPAAAVQTLVGVSTNHVFFDSLDQGVGETLTFLQQRAQKCDDYGEQYVLAGYSQGAMVMHRVLWQLTNPDHQNARWASQVLPRLDGILAIADGDRVAYQGGISYGTAGPDGEGVWWTWGGGARYKPVHASVPDLPEWPAGRFHSVCDRGDVVCDFNHTGLGTRIAAGAAVLWPQWKSAVGKGLKVHTEDYKPGGDSAVNVASAAADIARTTKQLYPLPLPPGTPVRVGQRGTVTLAGDGGNVASLEWLSDAPPGAVLDPGAPTMPATVAFSPAEPGTWPFAVRVTFTDGHTQDVTGAFTAYAVPEPSIAIGNVSSYYEDGTHTSEPGIYPGSVVTFDLSKTRTSDTSPVRVTSIEDPASDFFSYVSGDTNGNGVLDSNETWAYRGVVTWYDWETANPRTRTLQVWANDTTGAGAFVELTQPVTLTR